MRFAVTPPAHRPAEVEWRRQGHHVPIQTPQGAASQPGDCRSAHQWVESAHIRPVEQLQVGEQGRSAATWSENTEKQTQKVCGLRCNGGRKILSGKPDFSFSHKLCLVVAFMIASKALKWNKSRNETIANMPWIKSLENWGNLIPSMWHSPKTCRIANNYRLHVMKL